MMAMTISNSNRFETTDWIASPTARGLADVFAVKAPFFALEFTIGRKFEPAAAAPTDSRGCGQNTLFNSAVLIISTALSA